MVTAAAGSVALVMAPLVKNHGVEYLVPAVLLAGMIQIALGLGGVANLMRFIPRSVMNGFVNALAILIFLAQLQHVIHVPWMVYVLVAISLAIMVIWPRVNRVIPGPLVAIVVVTALAILGHIDVPTVRDQGELPHGVPSLIIPDIVFGFRHFGVIAPYALGAAIVGSDGGIGRCDVRRRLFDDGLAFGRPENAPENAIERDSSDGCDNYCDSGDQ